MAPRPEPLLALSFLLGCRPAPPPAPPPPTVLVAVDGISERLCSSPGERPHLAALVQSGCASLEPVVGGPLTAWTTLVAGGPPGEHGVFADAEMLSLPPDPSRGQRQRVLGPRRSPPFWEGGSDLVVLGLPSEAPPLPLPGVRQMLGPVLPNPWEGAAPGWGLGVEAPGLRTAHSEGQQILLPLGEPVLQIPPIRLTVGQGRIQQADTDEASVALRADAWSDPLPLFLAAEGRFVRAWTRVWMLQAEPLRLVVLPLSAEASAPWLPLSHPTMAALELEQAVGPAWTAARGALPSAVRSGGLPEKALTQAREAAVARRTRAATWALSTWGARYVLLALPEVADLPGDSGLDAVEEVLAALTRARADVHLVSVRGFAECAPLQVAVPGLSVGPYGAVRAPSGLEPARRLGVLEQAVATAGAIPGVAEVQSRQVHVGANAGLAPDLQLVPAPGSCLSPARFHDVGGVVVGSAAQRAGGRLARVGPMTMSRLVSE